MHELLTSPTRKLLGGGDFGILFFAWVLPAGIAVLVVLLLFIPFLRKLASDTRNRFLFAGAVFLSGAIGCELAGGKVAQWQGGANLSYVLLTPLEEGLEMVGAILFIRALLIHLGSLKTILRIEFKQPQI